MRDLHSREDELRELSDHELARRAEDAGLERPLDRNRDWLVSALARDGYDRNTGRGRDRDGDGVDDRDDSDDHDSTRT